MLDYKNEYGQIADIELAWDMAQAELKFRSAADYAKSNGLRLAADQAVEVARSASEAVECAYVLSEYNQITEYEAQDGLSAYTRSEFNVVAASFRYERLWGILGKMSRENPEMPLRTYEFGEDPERQFMFTNITETDNWLRGTGRASTVSGILFRRLAEAAKSAVEK